MLKTQHTQGRLHMIIPNDRAQIAEAFRGPFLQPEADHHSTLMASGACIAMTLKTWDFPDAAPICSAFGGQCFVVGKPR